MNPASGKRFLLLTLLFAGGALSQEADFQSLFDGRSLAGWEGKLSVFHVEDAAIVAGNLNDRIPRNEFLVTDRSFADFELRLQAKLVGAGDNAGIQFRSRRIPDHHEVMGYQCDMGSAFGGSVWGALYDESRRNRMLAQGDQARIREVFRPDDWNDFVIRCEGARIQIWLNGYQTVDYAEAEDVPREGIIGLQIHGGEPAEARYRNIRIKVL
jgi:hypothetical protein